jgi:hypothetical protein
LWNEKFSNIIVKLKRVLKWKLKNSELSSDFTQGWFGTKERFGVDSKFRRFKTHIGHFYKIELEPTK